MRAQGLNYRATIDGNLGSDVLRWSMDVRETGNHVARAEGLLAEARTELEQWNDDPGRGNADLVQLDEKIERATIILNEARLALDRVANAFPTGLIPITRARGWGGRRDRF